MRKFLQKEEILGGLVVVSAVVIIGNLVDALSKDDVGYSLWTELTGGAMLVLVSWGVLRYVRHDRKSAMRRLLRSHGFLLHGWILSINGIIEGKWTGVETGAESRNLTQQVEDGHIEPWIYVGFLRTLVITNENAKRVIDINDAISADTILRLESYEISDLYELTLYTYYLVGNFEYMINRLSHRDFMKRGYGDFDPDAAAQVVETLIKDLADFGMMAQLKKYMFALRNALTTLGEKETDIDKLLDETQWQMTIDGNGIPRVRSKELDDAFIPADETASLAAIAESPLLRTHDFTTTKELTKALKNHRQARQGKPKSPLSILFGGRI